MALGIAWRALDQERRRYGKKLLVVGAVLALAGLFVAVLASGSSGSPAATTGRTFTLTAQFSEFESLDLGAAGPSLGDETIFSGPLIDSNGETAGRYDGHCVITSVGNPPTEEEHRQQCFLTTAIVSGETEIESQGVGRVLAEDFLLGVTGGTGPYNNVRGEILFALQENRDIVLEFRLIGAKGPQP